MFLVIQGNDQLQKKEKKVELLNKYKTDDFNFLEFTDSIDIGTLSSAIHQSPMFADYFLVIININKRQFIRLKDYLIPSEYTVLLLILDDFVLSDELSSGLEIDEIFDCKALKYKETVRWIQNIAKQYGFSLDLEDRKELALMFQSSKELSDVLFQMSLLDEYERVEFFKELVSTRQDFVWNIFISLINKEKKEFFQRYAEQLKQNIELTKSQFNMKLIGGLLFCLKSWKDSPSWIYDRLDKLEEDEDVLIPFLYSHLIELLVMARKEQSNIPILVRFASLMEKQQKFS